MKLYQAPHIISLSNKYIVCALLILAEAKAFGEVKLGELPGWLASRNKTPAGVGRAMSRAYWRWNHKYAQPKVLKKLIPHNLTNLFFPFISIVEKFNIIFFEFSVRRHNCSCAANCYLLHSFLSYQYNKILES